MSAYAEVIVTLPVEGRYHYALGAHTNVSIGHRVLVQFGARKATAFVVALSDDPPAGFDKKKIRKISAVLDAQPLLTPDLLSIVAFAANYYLEPEGSILKVALPPGITATSIAKYRLTADGKTAVAGDIFDANERELLEQAAGAGVRCSQVNRTVADRLAARGWITRSDDVGAQPPERGIEIVRRIEAVDAELRLVRAPARRRIYAALTSPRPTTELVDQFGRNARASVRALEEDGLVVRERIAASVIHQQLGEDDRGVELTDEQTAALGPIVDAIDGSKATQFLLRGVTGSGKTEVYLRAIEAARKKNCGAIVLVPEIALTTQLEARFAARFGDDVVVLHSALTDKERRRRWNLLHIGSANIAVGPRSAVWAPIRDLGVIVVDEEHDSSFKQHSDVRYNGRDLALVRATKANAIAILGSATPSLETRRRAEQGQLVHLRLAKRVANRPLPEVSVIDLREAMRDIHGEPSLLSRPLQDALHEVIAAKEQAIIFLNRRGFNTVVVCDECGEARRCPHCSVSLTHHKGAGVVRCHYCGHHEPFVTPCVECGQTAMKPFGAGTERVAQLVQETVADARVIRLDRDITAKTGALDATLDKFRTGAADVLVGTQMVAKGHDFPRVTLVGIVLADASLSFPDFRAAERTFQLITQVAGRAGRAERPGRVIVQTFQPTHYTLGCAIEHDDDKFFEIECAARERGRYPPFARLGIIRIESDNEDVAKGASFDAARYARHIGAQDKLRVKGPVDAPIARIRGRTRRMVMILAPTPAKLVNAMRFVKQQMGKTTADVIYDVDASDML